MLNRLQQHWYRRSPWVVPLLPLAALFCGAVLLRRFAYRIGFFTSYRIAVPVIIVGNITVGGTGKTPLVAWLANYLRHAGYRPGIVSRGYKGAARHWPQQVRADSDPVMVGDEAVLLAQRCQCPMSVGPDRVAAARALVEHSDCDLIICDDGLQHYALDRDIEIAVIDGVRRFGNGFCLPAGPLREPSSRLRQVDLVVANGLGGRAEYPMKMRLESARNLADPQQVQELQAFSSETVHAVAGIGHPERFFHSLRKLGLQIVEHPFPDHHPFAANDLQFESEGVVLMTEKDAVKYRAYAQANHWFIPVTIEPDQRLGARILSLLKELPLNDAASTQ